MRADFCDTREHLFSLACFTAGLGLSWGGCWIVLEWFSSSLVTRLSLGLAQSVGVGGKSSSSANKPQSNLKGSLNLRLALSLKFANRFLEV